MIGFHLRRVSVALVIGTLLAGCSTSSGPVTPNVQQATRSIASSTNAFDSSQIVYDANPPTKFAFASLPAAATSLTPSYCVKKYGVACYTPALMRTGYDVPASATGAGQTIAIVDAYGSPTIQQDCATFSAIFGLPTCKLNIIYPGGAPTFNSKQHHGEAGWAFETSLDVEYAHAIAPDATINLVIAANSGGNVLNNAERYVVANHLGSVMTMSFGAPESAIRGSGNNLQLMQADAIYKDAAAAGITVLASAGDSGASNGGPAVNPLFPSSDPHVTAVGGTDVFLSDSGVYRSEYAWDDAIAAQCPFGCQYGAIGAGGGAPSAIFTAAPYQSAVSGQSARTTADIAYNAGVYTSVLVYLSFPSIPAGFYFVGGTSAGSPQWAGIVADANASLGHAIGELNPHLYAIGADPAAYASAFHDITVGSNAFFGPGFSAGTGYDIPTGLGSPDVKNLLTALATH